MEWKDKILTEIQKVTSSSYNSGWIRNMTSVGCCRSMYWTTEYKLGEQKIKRIICCGLCGTCLRPQDIQEMNRWLNQFRDVLTADD